MTMQLSGKSSLPVRALAARVLAKVRAGESSLSEMLPTADSQLTDGRDRAFLRLVVYRTIRTVYRREAALALLMPRPLPSNAREVEALLLLGLTQLDENIDSDYAVLDASVEATRALGKPKLAALVNAVLRRAQRMTGKLYPADAEVQQQYDHPTWMIERIRADWPETWQAILTANNARAPLWLRVNRRRTTRTELQQRLAESGILATPHRWLADALEVLDAGDVTQMPGWDEGHFSVQDAAAQAAVELMDLRPGLRVLDACTAPGGKIAHIAEREPELEMLLGIDNDGRRLERTRTSMARLGLRPMLKQADGLLPDTWWKGALFDRILVDAPCSGTGVIRRHPDIRLLRRGSDIAPLVQRQREMLDALWPLLAPGGRLVYATCSVLKDENERQFDGFLSRHRDARAIPAPIEHFGSTAGAGRQNLPGVDGADGFFYAVVDKAVV